GYLTFCDCGFSERWTAPSLEIRQFLSDGTRQRAVDCFLGVLGLFGGFSIGLKGLFYVFLLSGSCFRRGGDRIPNPPSITPLFLGRVFEEGGYRWRVGYSF